MSRKATQPRAVLPIAPQPTPTLDAIVSQDGRGTDWTSPPATWEGSGAHEVRLWIDSPWCRGTQESVHVKLLLFREYGDPVRDRLQLDIDVADETVSKRGDVEYRYSLELRAEGVVALAEALRRLLPLARAQGLLPAENPA